jgi:hypothetical protein
MPDFPTDLPEAVRLAGYCVQSSEVQQCCLRLDFSRAVQLQWESHAAGSGEILPASFIARA